ncbi:MAG: helix-turn-helix domain-containing protein [Thermoproteota archaeon]
MYLSIKKLADYIGVHPNTLRRWIKMGMPHYRFGKRVLIKVSEFDEWMEKFRVKGSATKDKVE